MQRAVKRIAVAMSGGVDSTVAAIMLKRQGYDVVGVHMHNWNEYDEQGFCSGEDDYQYALKAANSAHIPLHKVTFEKEYWNKVFSQVVEGYGRGITPNPDTLCNKYIKFGALFEHTVDRFGVDWLATGHYARLKYSKHGVKLLKARDQNKDQTFFLAQVSQEALRKTLFPIGHLTKTEVKRLARYCHLDSIANKRESFGLCFIGKRNFGKFINEYLDTPAGQMVDVDTGRVVSNHQGIHNWTIGQRTYLPNQRSAYYVCSIDAENSIVYVAAGRENPALSCDTFTCGEPHWISDAHKEKLETDGLLICELRTRHRAQLSRCTIYSSQFGLTVELSQPLQGLVCPGQFSVFYDGEECIGSAAILKQGLCEQQSLTSS